MCRLLGSAAFALLVHPCTPKECLTTHYKSVYEKDIRLGIMAQLGQIKDKLWSVQEKLLKLEMGTLHGFSKRKHNIGGLLNEVQKMDAY